MFFIIFIIFICVLLGHLSYRINVLNKGATEFLPKVPKELFKIIIYTSVLILLNFFEKDNSYKIITIFLALCLLAYDLNKEIREKYSNIIESIPPAFIKITLMLISVLVIAKINQYTTTTIGLGISNFSGILTSITFIFTLGYFGSILLLIIALIIEFGVIYSILKMERITEKIRISLYNLLTDNNKLKPNIISKPNNYLELPIKILQLYLTLYVLSLTNFMNEIDNNLEKIIVSVAYSDIYPGCKNIIVHPLSKIMFIDPENISVATPSWSIDIPEKKRTENNIEKYIFHYQTCQR